MKEKFLKALVIYFLCVNALYTADLSGEAQQESLSNPTEPHPVAEQAISRLKSPYCPGLMLEVCTSLEAAMLRDSLQVMAREGNAFENSERSSTLRGEGVGVAVEAAG